VLIHLLERLPTRNTVGKQARGVNYTLNQLALLLVCPFDEARAWVRALELKQPILRDARGARTVTAVQLETIALARVVAAERGLSKPTALKAVGQLGRAQDALGLLEANRVSLGVVALERRVAALEATLSTLNLERTRCCEGQGTPQP
jgi:hypothetical protein